MEGQINLLPKQTEAWELWENPEITELGYGGGAGGGKTRLGIYLAISIAEMYPTSTGAIARKELKNLRLTTLNEFFMVLNELGYKQDFDFKFDAKDGIIIFGNKSKIFLLDTAYSPQDPEYTRFGSLNLTWAWVEESNESPEKAISILKTRVGRNNVIKDMTVKPFWLETFNPNKGHVYRTYYKPYKENTMPSYRAFVQALPTDNPYLPDAYIENLKRADKVTKERLLYGNFDFDSNPMKIINYEAIQDLTTNTITELSPNYLINDIARFGGDKIVLGWFEGLNLSGLYVYTYQDIDTTKQRIKSIAERKQIPFSHILSDEDGVGGGVVDGMRGTKGFLGGSRPFDIFDTNQGKFVPANFENLRSQCYFKLAETINQHKISIKIKEFETNIEGYTEAKALDDLFEELDAIEQKDNTGNITKLAIIPKALIKEKLGRSPDFSDVLMMRMYFMHKEGVKEQDIIQARFRIHKSRRNILTNQVE